MSHKLLVMKRVVTVGNHTPPQQYSNQNACSGGKIDTEFSWAGQNLGKQPFRGLENPRLSVVKKKKTEEKGEKNLETLKPV